MFRVRTPTDATRPVRARGVTLRAAMMLLVAASSAGCTDGQGTYTKPPATEARAGFSPAGRPTRAALVLLDAPLQLALSATAVGIDGRTPGDTTVRLTARPLPRPDDGARLCSAIASGFRTSTKLPWGMPIDTAAPRLLRAVVSGNAVYGVRFVVPGAQSMWVFEGITTVGMHQVSMRWPVRSDPTTPIPADATDSVIADALTPHPRQLDSLILALRDTAAARRVMPRSERAAVASPAWSRAVPLYSDLPVHEITLSDACPDATFSLPMIARVDQLLRIPVQRGDRVDAESSVEYGRVRLSFDEVPPSTDAPSAPPARASAVAAADGRLTLRVALSTTPRQQRPDQMVLVHLALRR